MRLDRASAMTLSVILLSMASADVSAQQSRRGRGLSGDWHVKMNFGGNEWESILAFSRDDSGNRTGQWISLWGATDLKDVSYEDGKLSFTQSREDRNGETMTSKFTGTIKEGKLTGSLSSDRGEFSVEGAREPRSPRVAGNWETKFTIGEREITNTLILKADKDGKLAVDWQSERVKHKISNVLYERGKLTFKTNSTMDDREWQSSFEGTFRGNAYSGVVKFGSRRDARRGNADRLDADRHLESDDRLRSRRPEAAPAGVPRHERSLRVHARQEDRARGRQGQLQALGGIRRTHVRHELCGKAR